MGHERVKIIDKREREREWGERECGINEKECGA